MTANVYLVKIAEMNKAAGDADDNKPSITRGALVGAGWGAGIGAGAGLGVGRYVGGQLASGMPEGLSIGRKVRNGAKMGLKGEITPTGSAPVERMSNRIARTSERAGKYLTRHPVRGGRAMFTGLMGGVGLAAGSLAGASSGASVQVARRLMDKEASMNKTAGDADDNKPSIGRGALVGATLGGAASASAGHIAMGKALQQASPRQKKDAAKYFRNELENLEERTGSKLPKSFKQKPLRTIHRGVAGIAGVAGMMAGAPVGMAVQGVRRLMDKEASENRYLVKIAAEYSKGNPYTEPMDATIGRHATTGAKIGAGVGGVVGAGLGAAHGHPIAGAIGGALGGGLQFGMYGVGTGLLTGAYNAHKREAWEKAHRKVAEEIPGYFHTVGQGAGKGGEIGGVIGSVVGGIDGTVEGLRRGKGVVGKAVNVAKEGLKHSIVLGGVGGGLGGAVGGTLGGVAGTFNLGRKGVRVIQDAAK